MHGDPLTKADLDRLRAGAGTNADVRRLVDQYRRLEMHARCDSAREDLMRGDLEAELESARDEIVDLSDDVKSLKAEREVLRADVQRLQNSIRRAA